MLSDDLPNGFAPPPPNQGLAASPMVGGQLVGGGVDPRALGGPSTASQIANSPFAPPPPSGGWAARGSGDPSGLCPAPPLGSGGAIVGGPTVRRGIPMPLHRRFL